MTVSHFSVGKQIQREEPPVGCSHAVLSSCWLFSLRITMPLVFYPSFTCLASHRLLIIWGMDYWPHIIVFLQNARKIRAFYLFIFWQGLQNSPSWPQIHNPFALTSQVLELQAYATTYSLWIHISYTISFVGVDKDLMRIPPIKI